MQTRAQFFAAAREFAPGKRLTSAAQITALNAAADALGLARDDVAPPFNGTINVKVALELMEHEAIVLEWYKDSVGIGTWGIGVTNASGHRVDRYKDKPQTIAHVVAIYVWLLRNKYAPEVLLAFKGHTLTEAQFAAALSFNYNTGAILRASWVQLFKAGKVAEARAAIMHWDKPAAIIGRRTKERDLFFDGKWSQDGKVIVYPVRKPSYAPNWSAGVNTDVRAQVAAALGAA
jgi:lysozyme